MSELANVLARELQVELEFIPVSPDTIRDQIENGACDIIMSGVAVTTERAESILFSESYMDETFAFVVRDHLRHEFNSWEEIRAIRDLEIVVPNVPYYIDKLKEALPHAKLRIARSARDAFSNDVDVLAIPAERGAIWTILHPGYSVAVPQPIAIKIPLAYPLARKDVEWESFVNTWIDLKKKDRTIDALYDYWILGKNPERKSPRWSIMRNVLHWID